MLCILLYFFSPVCGGFGVWEIRDGLWGLSDIVGGAGGGGEGLLPLLFGSSRGERFSGYDEWHDEYCGESVC